jgi:SAM-dependent methyltransferase
LNARYCSQVVGLTELGARSARAALVTTARGLERARAWCVSLAAATLRLREVRAGIEETWRGFAAGEAEIDAGLDPAETSVVSKFITAGDRVLVVGCGTGRDVIPLVRMGCEVVGVDPVREAVATARRALEARGLRASIVEGYFEESDVPGGFDVILFSNHCYSYIPGRRRRVEVLRKAGARLTAPGHLLVTYIASPSPSGARSLRAMRSVSRLTGSDWQPEAGDRLEPLDGARGSFAYEHLFRPGEVEEEAGDAGLTVLPHREHPHARQMLVLVSD